MLVAGSGSSASNWASLRLDMNFDAGRLEKFLGKNPLTNVMYQRTAAIRGQPKSQYARLSPARQQNRGDCDVSEIFMRRRADRRTIFQLRSDETQPPRRRH